MGENQRSGEEIGENQRSGEEIDESQRSDEEIDQYQNNDKEISENQRGDKEIEGKGPRCIVSDPAQSHYLTYRAHAETKNKCFSCGEKDVSWKDIDEDFHYYCTVCDLEFHTKCLEFPRKMIHPYHPQHPLIFTFIDYKTRIIADTNYHNFSNFQYDSDMNLFKYPETIDPNPSTIFNKCAWCSNDLGKWFYRCSICSFSLDLCCARNIPSLTIKYPKSHHHSLFLFPRPLSFPCDACGSITVLEPSYACYQCNYFVHQSCIDLPRVIKITRHPHRLSYTPYLPIKVSMCRVCYKNVDLQYGQYSCNDEDCSYVVHSKCATHKKVWDGGELEWEPEESDQTEDVSPYKKVGLGLIEHFCHEHCLRLETYDVIRHSEKQCHACIRPVSHRDFYNCTECDFSLHELCANLPRKLEHALHKHQLYAYWDSLYHFPELSCSACSRLSAGFKYKCIKEGCQFQLDIHCIMVPEIFTHRSHEEHPLEISTSYSDDDKVLCQSCKANVCGGHLHCTDCKFAICWTCATIPSEIDYEYEEHPLHLCYGKSGVDNMYWCEVCEKELDPTQLFYTNDECYITIHLKCLFGDNAYMKSGHKFTYLSTGMVEVVGNGSSNRPTCYNCHHYCPYPVYFKVHKEDGTKVDICSFSCFKGLVSI